MSYFKTLLGVCLVLLVSIQLGCKKETNKAKPLGITKKANALIINTGPVAADGCGFLVKVDSNFYHADNLPSQFQRDSLIVDIDYISLTTKFQCSMNPNNILPVIHINTIK